MDCVVCLSINLWEIVSFWIKLSLEIEMASLTGFWGFGVLGFWGLGFRV